jgi:hypothetical protein
VTRTGQKRNINIKLWWGNLEERDQSDEPDVDLRIIIKWNMWIGFMWVMTGTRSRSL